MAVDYLDLETRPAGPPAQSRRPTLVVPPVEATPAEHAVADDVVDVTDQAASYWVRRKRAEAMRKDF